MFDNFSSEDFIELFTVLCPIFLVKFSSFFSTSPDFVFSQDSFDSVLGYFLKSVVLTLKHNVRKKIILRKHLEWFALNGSYAWVFNIDIGEGIYESGSAVSLVVDEVILPG